ncbi:MAG: hypothetical protein BMS9Abin37_1471 [Acidobacteriota bacterium]|nr:MAG: hypothetical protein BMS9Abin37_1471 [Acidobacteriota bacterium]
MSWIRHRRPSAVWLVLASLAATVLVVQSSCADLNQVSSPNEVLILSASPSAIDADGFSTTTITAEVSPRTDQNLRDVIFTTTLGSFPASVTGNETSIVATVNSAGVASVALQSSPQTGTAVVTAEIREGDAVKVARSTRVDFTAIRASDVIAVRALTTVAPADGATVTDIIVQLNGEVPVNQREILFSTTLGTFGALSPTATRLAGTDNSARAGLVSPRTTGAGVVTAELNDQKARVTIQFEPALPEQIAVSLFGSLQLKATFTSKVTVNVEMERSTGKVTPGLEVVYRVFDASTGNLFGFFSGTTLVDSNGNSQANFTPGNTGERGEATIRVRIPGTSVSGRVRIEIVDP